MSSIKLFNCVKIKTILQNRIAQRGVIQLRNISGCQSEDVATHTGQKFEKNDYRLSRFVDRPKQVNKQFAIDLIAKVPPKHVTSRVVYCDGGDDHTGHPRVYINLDKPGNHTCGYCGLRFVLDHSNH